MCVCTCVWVCAWVRQGSCLSCLATTTHADCPHKILDFSLFSQALHKLTGPKGFTVLKGWAISGMFLWGGGAGVARDKTYFLADRKFNFLSWLTGGLLDHTEALRGPLSTQDSCVSPLMWTLFSRKCLQKTSLQFWKIKISFKELIKMFQHRLWQ